jgi:hypothetical protein
MQLGEGIQACLDKKLYPPALILIYSAIDITSWLASDNPKASVRKRFTTWVNKYLLYAKPLGCTAIELYSARCGIIHTYTAFSKLVEKGKARIITYAWGTAKSSDFQKLIDMTSWTDKAVVLHVEELYEAWRLGLLAFVDELKDDRIKAQAVYERSSNFFDNLAADKFDSLLKKSSE